MKIVYRIPINQGIVLSVPNTIESISVDGVDIDWEIDSNGHLSSVKLGISGAELQVDERGVIISGYPEVEEKVFRIASYISNRILCQTGIDALNPERIFDGSPAISPETPDEEKEFAGRKRYVDKRLSYSWKILGAFEPKNYRAEHIYSTALAHYAEGIRAQSPFLRYEQFFKVIEYFFPNKDTLEAEVSNYALKYDNRFDEKQIHYLKRLRHRSIHPHVNDGHLNPSEKTAINELKPALFLLQKLIEILLEHPPK